MSLPNLDHKHELNLIISFIQSTFTQTQHSKAIIATSGGIDSATTLTLTAHALGPKNVLALHLPAKSSHPIHSKHAYLAMDHAQILPENRLTIQIGSIIQKTWRIIKHYTDDSPLQAEYTQAPKSTLNKKTTNQLAAAHHHLRLANIAARARMIVLYDQAKKHHALVVGTENYSEHLLGYFTRFGDEASDLEPIKHLYKTEVYQLAKHLEIPQPIMTKAPSADLWPGQTDSGELGFTYKEADPILNLLDHGKSANDIINSGYPETLVHSIKSQMDKIDFKHHVPYRL